MAVATAASLQSQSLTGNIEGRLLAAGAPVARAVVSATGPALQGTRVVTSDRQGVFGVPAMPVGRTPSASHISANRPLAIQAVVVHLGRTTSVGTITLQATTTLLPELVVTPPPTADRLAWTATATRHTTIRATETGGSSSRPAAPGSAFQWISEVRAKDGLGCDDERRSE